MGVIYILIALPIVGTIVGIIIACFDKCKGKKSENIKVDLSSLPESPVTPGTDTLERKTLGQQFDTRATNIFRPYGGLFGDD